MKPLLVIIGSVISLGGLIFTSFFTPKFENVRKNTPEKVTTQRVDKPKVSEQSKSEKSNEKLKNPNKPDSPKEATLTGKTKTKVSAPKVGKKELKGDKKRKAKSERIELTQDRRKKNG